MLISNTAERLNYLMNTTGLKQADILKKCKPYCEKYNVKMGRSALSQYVSGEIAPKQDKLTILGLALNVDEVWLMGYDVPMERKSRGTQTSNLENTNNYLYDIDMINLWKNEIGTVEFSNDEITELINYAKFILSKRGGK